MECLLIEEETDNFCKSCFGFCKDPLGCLDSFLIDSYSTLDEEEELKKEGHNKARTNGKKNVQLNKECGLIKFLEGL